MSELSGTLEGVGLPAIVRFLTGLKKTGCLRVVQEGWAGEIFFNSGEVTNAAFGSRHGLQALDALVEALPNANFVFDSDAPRPENGDVSLSADALHKHLDELVAHTATGVPHLPALESVPTVVEQPDSGNGQEPLPLDRGTLQTLLAVDGQRSVREIITQRGSFDALWQLSNLIDVGLVRLSAGANASVAAAQAPPAVEVEAPPPANNVSPIGIEIVDAPVESVRCPKLGFEDDPSTSFARPTRLHRCFAAGTPLPLSLDQQRELCISDQFGTCPRLAIAGTGPAPAASSRSENGVAPVTDDPRIVRLPVGGRNAAAARESVADRQAVGGSEPSRYRSTSAPTREAGAEPTPLRSRQERAVRPEPAAVAAKPPAAPPTARDLLVDDSDDRRFAGVPVQVLAAVLVVMIVLGTVGFLLAPHVGDLFSDEPSDVDIGSLPNSSAIAAGTPIAQITDRATPAARASAAPANATGVTGTSPSGASAANAPARPTLLPEPTPAPTPAPPSDPVAAVGNSVFDERFDTNNRNWPSNAQGTAVFNAGNYRIIPRSVGQFVAIDAPLPTPLQDVVVNATFRKVSGPAGGGYGIIVRDQATTPQNGTAQNGKYYVLEVGDIGQVGIWRRDDDHWVDLLPWQKAEIVKPGVATNDVTVRAIGNRLTMLVNGVEVATRTDDALTSGLVGVFVGGDGNEVAIDRFSVQTP